MGPRLCCGVHGDVCREWAPEGAGETSVRWETLRGNLCHLEVPQAAVPESPRSHAFHREVGGQRQRLRT